MRLLLSWSRFNVCHIVCWSIIYKKKKRKIIWHVCCWKADICCDVCIDSHTRWTFCTVCTRTELKNNVAQHAVEVFSAQLMVSCFSPVSMPIWWPHTVPLSLWCDALSCTPAVSNSSVHRLSLSYLLSSNLLADAQGHHWWNQDTTGQECPWWYH